ncbi:MAG TPA: NAD(P)/FAD-dependent oxidoreductase [Myxococcota bacterium]|nr:NAD(P)/FAD-dependent oxidoreductase [Myxococcota bacterium]
MVSSSYDVVVIGGGPAGASAGAMLAIGGRSVLVLERERFPRFHIGESLLPAIWDLVDRIGVREALENAGFTIKQGVMFGMFNAAEDVKLLTAEYPEYFPRPWTYHVERAKFDQILLDNARAKGADVREEWTVHEVIFEGDTAVGVMAGSNGAPPQRIDCKVVVDATGRDCLLARHLGWRRPDPTLNKISHFAHYTGCVRRDPTEVVGTIAEVLPTSSATDIHTIDGGWLWFIPLSNDVVSVGAVLDAKVARSMGEDPQARLDAAIGACHKMSRWMADAKQTLEVQTISNVSYLNDRFVGNGFVLIGDSAMFIDPIFSAGVTLAIRAAVFSSECILDGFRRNDFRAEVFAPYERQIKRPMFSIFQMIYNWYEILKRRDANNIFSRARQIPLLRERFIVLLSGGYDRMDLEHILKAAGEPPEATEMPRFLKRALAVSENAAS